MRSSTYLDEGIKYSKHNLKILQIHYRAHWKCLNYIARSVLTFLEIYLCAFSLVVISTWSQVLLLLGMIWTWIRCHRDANLLLYSKTIIIFHFMLCRNTLHQFYSFTWEGLNYEMNERNQLTCNPFPSNIVTFSRLSQSPFQAKHNVWKSKTVQILNFTYLFSCH